MNKINFARSQSAHKRLAKKNGELYYKTGKVAYGISRLYHKQVVENQSFIGRVLTKDEKKAVFRNSKGWFN